MAGRLKRAEFRGSACPTTWVTAIRIAVTPSGGYAEGWETTTTWVVFAGSIVEFPTSWMTYVCLSAVGSGSHLGQDFRGSAIGVGDVTYDGDNGEREGDAVGGERSVEFESLADDAGGRAGHREHRLVQAHLDGGRGAAAPEP
ncbi:hypothetical protein ACWGH8_05885 [Nonomuraea muscovyensis]